MFDAKRKSWEYSDEEIINLSKEVENDLQNFIASRSRWQALLKKRREENCPIKKHILPFYIELEKKCLVSPNLNTEGNLSEMFENLVFLSNGDIQIAVNVLHFAFNQYSQDERRDVIIHYLQTRWLKSTKKENNND